MLKDVTLGQYFPGDTPIHRLDPRAKILALAGYIVALFVADGFSGYGIMLLLLAVASATAKIKPKTLLSGLKPLLFILIFTGVLNLFYGTGEPLVKLWVFSITASGIKSAIFMVMRIMILVCGTFLLTYTTSPLSLTDGLERLLSPLKKIRVPVHELSMMMSIALRFIPTLIEETDRIMSAQRARGASFDTGKLKERAAALLPLLVPLFISAFRRAEELATAMECRCYHGGEGRTRMKKLSFKRSDFFAIALMLAIVALVFFSRELPF